MGEMRIEEAARILERRAAELVKLYKQYACASLQLVELFAGEDDGGSRTYRYYTKQGILLERTTEVLRRLLNRGYMRPYGGGGRTFDVHGVYALADGIVVQIHETVLNAYGNPVKDYGSFPSLTALLLTVRVPAEEVLSAAREDIEELEHELDEMKNVRSHYIDKPYRGYIVAFCPQCNKLLRPSCKEEGERLVFVHQHQPVYIILREQGGERTVQCSAQDYQSLIDVVDTLWRYRGQPKVVERIISLWLLLKEQEEYENNVKAFFEQL
ncbi:MAG: hypothetical protein LM590_12425 [Thermofilum sp.]|nr:hypothetical protein [Thermofilum sp.]